MKKVKTFLILPLLALTMEKSDVDSIVDTAKSELNLKSVLIQESSALFELCEGGN